MEKFKIVKIKDRKKEIAEDCVVREIPLTISLGDKELVTLLCSPSDLRELVVGFLFTSGLIHKKSDISEMTVDEERWIAHITLCGAVIDENLVFKRLFTPGCGRGTQFYSAADLIHRGKNKSSVTFSIDEIQALLKEFYKKSDLYIKTGGVHSAAMADHKEILVFKEDIGRHNALDKVIGYSMSNEVSFDNKIMITSGRISSEVFMKIQKCGIPIIISRGAPTNQAIRHARDMGITLIGFARGDRMNIYSEEERIKI